MAQPSRPGTNPGRGRGTRAGIGVAHARYADHRPDVPPSPLAFVRMHLRRARSSIAPLAPRRWPRRTGSPAGASRSPAGRLRRPHGASLASAGSLPRTHRRKRSAVATSPRRRRARLRAPPRGQARRAGSASCAPRPGSRDDGRHPRRLPLLAIRSVPSPRPNRRPRRRQGQVVAGRRPVIAETIPRPIKVTPGSQRRTIPELGRVASLRDTRAETRA